MEVKKDFKELLGLLNSANVDIVWNHIPYQNTNQNRLLHIVLCTLCLAGC